MLPGRTSVLGVMLVLAAACGGSETAAPPSSSTTAAPPAGPAVTADQSAPATSPARTVVPDVVVRDVASGADVQLRTAAARPDRPTLYWFWAPH